MSESKNYRGYDVEANESSISLNINGRKVNCAKTSEGFRVEYQPPRATLLEAAESFLDTQPTAIPYRKGFTELTDDERRRFADALNQLYNNGATGNLISANAKLHNDNFYKGIHWGPVFLPWHRDLIRNLEIEIQKIHSDLTFPYWDWTRADSMDLDAEPWKSIFGGRNNTGGLFDHWNYNRNSGPNGWVLPMLVSSSTSPNAVSVVEELQATTYQDFRRLETGSHVPGHTWTGGTMASGASPGDPLFYLHHCNLDRLWSIWQLNNPAADQYTLDSILSDSVPEAAVPLNDPMIGGATPASMLNHESLGYRYARDMALENAWSDSGLGTLITTS